MNRPLRMRTTFVAVIAAGLAALGLGIGPVAATTTVTALNGAGFGYSAQNIKLFGGAQAPAGPAPTATLVADGSNSPQSGSITTAIIAYGPATIFTSDAESVSTSGSAGSAGSATTTAQVNNINKASTQPATGSEPFTADQVASTCTASTAGVSGSVAVSPGAVLVTSTDSNGNPVTTVTVPTSPAPNTTYTGTINTVGDSFKYVFNEQVVNADGSLTVDGYHEYLLGPTATGDVHIAKSQCGVTVTTSNAAPVAANDSYSTAFGTALTIAAPGVLGNDTDPDGDALTAAVASNPPHGSLSLAADGGFTYTPAAGYSGPDSFTYTAKDPSNATSTATAAITVGAPPPADLAVTGTGPASVTTGGTVSDTFTVANLSTGTPATGARLSVVPSGGSLATVPAGCTVAKGKTKTVTCMLATIAPGASATVTLTVVAPKKPGSITVTGTSAYSGDPDISNNTVTIVTAVAR